MAKYLFSNFYWILVQILSYGFISSFSKYSLDCFFVSLIDTTINFTLLFIFLISSLFTDLKTLDSKYIFDRVYISLDLLIYPLNDVGQWHFSWPRSWINETLYPTNGLVVYVLNTRLDVWITSNIINKNGSAKGEFLLCINSSLQIPDLNVLFIDGQYSEQIKHSYQYLLKNSSFGGRKFMDISCSTPETRWTGMNELNCRGNCRWSRLNWKVING